MGFWVSMQIIGPLLKFLWRIIKKNEEGKKDKIVYDEPLKKVYIGAFFNIFVTH